MREKAIKIKRKRCASDWFLDIFKVVFLVLVTCDLCVSVLEHFCGIH